MRREDVRATLTIQAGLVAATVTGFLREATLAYQLGAGRATDVYLIAFTLPEFVFTALPIVLIPAVIPLYIQARSCAGEVAAWRFARRAAGAVVGVLLALTLLVALGVPLYVRWIAPGFGALEQAQAGRALRWMLPALALMGAATVAGAVLQVYRRFARPALATAVYNLTFAATLVALPLSWAVGRAAWGVTLGAAAALLFQLPLLWSRRPRPGGGEGGRKARP